MSRTPLYCLYTREAGMHSHGHPPFSPVHHPGAGYFTGAGVCRSGHLPADKAPGWQSLDLITKRVRQHGCILHAPNMMYLGQSAHVTYALHVSRERNWIRGFQKNSMLCLDVQFHGRIKMFNRRMILVSSRNDSAGPAVHEHEHEGLEQQQ